MITVHSLLDQVAEKTAESLRLLDTDPDDDDDRHAHTRQAIEQLVECIRILALEIEGARLPSFGLSSRAVLKVVCEDSC